MLEYYYNINYQYLNLNSFKKLLIDQTKTYNLSFTIYILKIYLQSNLQMC